VKIDAFPVDDVLSRASYNDIIDRLERFELDWTPPCDRCRRIDWVSSGRYEALLSSTSLYLVRLAAQATEAYFDGLCLDCMKHSKPRGRDLDAEYWKHNESKGGRWDTGCRISYNQSTWYVSWLGRDDMRQKLLKGTAGYRPDEDE
jgi:hypothetical protein